MAATTTTLTGTNKLAAGDFHTVKWTGKTKAGDSIEITMTDAYSKDPMALAFSEKNDIVPKITFEATYEQSDLDSEDFTEPWTVVTTLNSAGKCDNIVLGAGKITIDDTSIGLTRGGGTFTRTPDIREINADDDPGPVKERIVQQGARATLELNALTWLTKETVLFAGLSATT